MQNVYDEITVFASQALAVGVTNSPDQINATGKGVVLYLNITTISTGTLLLSLQGKDPITGGYYTIMADAFAISINGSFIFEVYPGVASIVSTSGTAPGDKSIRTSVAHLLPKVWRVVATVATAPVTAQVDGLYVN
jgi:hypothetical protein